MKYPVTQYNELKSALVVLKNHYDLNKETATAYAPTLYFKVYQQKTYKDQNGNVIKNADGSRLFELNEAFKLYPDGCNDTHIRTAMKNAINEIFN